MSAEQLAFEFRQYPRIVIAARPSITPSTHCSCCAYVVQRLEAAVDDQRQLRKVGLEATDARPVERRNGAILRGAEPGENRLARMHDERVAAGARDDFDEACEKVVVVVGVHAGTALHRHRNIDGRAHRGDAIGDEFRLQHQTRANARVLYTIGRAADVQVDFIEAGVGARTCAGGEARWVRAAELQAPRDAVPPNTSAAVRADRAATRRC